MAEERYVGTARAAEASATTDEETTKEELQRRMEEARESITQTVSEIKDTVATQYQTVKESINGALDWREQYRKRPVAFSIGAASVGFFVGYGIAAALSDDHRENDYSVFDVDADEDEDYSSQRSRANAPRAYAAGAITGTVSKANRENIPSANEDDSEKVDSLEPQKPGLIDRFKETRAFDRLQEEVSSLGDRFIDELSHTAQAVVLPALLGKLKDMIGIDLSAQQREAKRSELEKQTSNVRAEALDTNT